MFLSIVQRLERIVNDFPDKSALIIEQDRYTYTDLWNEIKACVSVLRSNNISTGDRVAILLDNSLDYISSYYGVLACGGVVVSLNTAASSADIMNWLIDSGSTILITNSKFDKFIKYSENSNQTLNILNLETMQEGNSRLTWTTKTHSFENYESELVKVDKGTIAAIIYTSGTTGNPKGVVLTHGNFIANFLEVIKYLNLTNDDSIVNILPFYYSYGNSVLHTHMLVGATIVIENSFMYPAKTIKKITDYKVTGFSGVPATYSILLNKVDLKEHDISSLRYVTQAGGSMPVANIRKFIQLAPNIDFYVMYGQTEATARLTYLEPGKLQAKIGSVGKPLNGIDIQIRDSDNLVLNSNQEGELFASGDNIMFGYWNNKELTDQVIINNYIRTGDFGYKDDDGYIYLTGRRSDMIKVGGNRISPLEIEEVVTQSQGIVEVVATGVSDDILGQVIKLTVVLDENEAVKEKEIKAYCRKHLALYKVPKYVDFVKSIPKTASGKVKRYLL